MTTALRPIRARDWLRRFCFAYRDAILLEHDDSGIVDIAEADGYHLTSHGDILCERDAAIGRLPALQ